MPLRAVPAVQKCPQDGGHKSARPTRSARG